jgi:hypothetical protein
MVPGTVMDTNLNTGGSNIPSAFVAIGTTLVFTMNHLVPLTLSNNSQKWHGMAHVTGL